LSRVRIPPTLRGETAGAREVEAEGRTVRELLDDLMGRFPALRGQLLAEDDDLAPFVNVYLDSEDVRTLDGLDTQVREGSTVILLPAMAGGEREVLAEGDTVRDLLDDLTRRFPALEEQIPFANVYVEGEDMRTLDGLETEVRPGPTVILLPAMAGG